jgi:hypothetical protein
MKSENELKMATVIDPNGYISEDVCDLLNISK